MKKAPYGSWKSDITPESLVDGGVVYRNIIVAGEDLYLLEARPKEKGRSVFVDILQGKDIFGPSFNARTTVHEYGGKCGIFHNKAFYFSNYSDQQIYVIRQNHEPKQLTHAPSMRFGDFHIHPNGKWLFAVVEDHEDPTQINNAIAKIDLSTGNIEICCSGHDFYMAPRINPSGDHLAFICWDHPNMPWDGTNLFVAKLGSHGEILLKEKIAGNSNESVVEPSWSPDGKLYFVSDRTGYWNIYDETQVPIAPMHADCAAPPWVLGNQSFTFITLDNTPYIAAIYTEKAIDHLALIHLKTKQILYPSLPYTNLSQIHSWKDKLVFIASSPKTPTELVAYDIQAETTDSLAVSRKNPFDPLFFCTPESISFKTEDHKTAFAFYYPPTNPNYVAESPNSKPPLIVFCHGGPTAHSSPSFSPSILFWTSRGFAVAVVNYGGSTGYGREYRRRLNRAWGIVDVNDCCNAARYLINKGLVDPSKIAIRGASAGGYTTLAALIFRDVFACGTSLFGVSDLEMLAKDTHKFESRYLDSLIGPYPEEKERYRQLSPLSHKDKLSRPVLLLQGAEDKIVPPTQAEEMYQALLEKQIPTKYVLFPGEQHGFRKAETIIQAISEEYSFYCSIFGIV